MSEHGNKKAPYQRLDRLQIPDRKPVAAWLKDLNIPILLYKQVFINKDSSHRTRYRVTNDLAMSHDKIETLYKKRWGVEEYHKSLKQNACIGSSPAHTQRTQSNHIFSAIYAYSKLERIKIERKINHFALKSFIYIESLKSAWHLLSTHFSFS